MAFLSTTRRTLTLTSLLSRTLSPRPSSSSLISSRSRFALALSNIHHHQQLVPESLTIPTRHMSAGSGYSPLNDPSPNWSNRPPKETILLDGCDYEHWLIVMEFPKDSKLTEEEMVNSYVNTLASVVGSEEEAKKKIYSVATNTYTGFGALISEELSYKVKGLPGVLWVLPDSYLDVPKKDYGGDLFIDGKVIHRPQFYYNDRTPNQTRRRPRYDRRRDTMQVGNTEPLFNWRKAEQQLGSIQGNQGGFNQGGQGGFDQVNQGGLNQGDQGALDQGNQGRLNQGDQGALDQGNQGGLNQGNQGGFNQDSMEPRRL